MADADEDEQPTAQVHDTNVDLTDETQDFRLLSIFAKDEHATIPKRGEKDFEPHGTSHQDTLLSVSRQAMHNALSTTRIQAPKAHLIGHWHASLNQCAVTQSKGPHFKTLGKADRESIVWLLPEETLYLLERGNLDVRWEQPQGNWVTPMSLQGAYAVCIGDEVEDRIGLERWTVYAALKRSGYVVMRAPSWTEPENEPPTGDQQESDRSSQVSEDSNLFQRLFAMVVPLKAAGAPPSFGPLAGPGLHRSYNDIYQRLRVIPSYDPTACKTKPPTSKSTKAPFRVAFHVWKPSPTFKKTAPGPPDYRIAVINARETALPTLQQLSGLLESVPYCPPPQAMNTRPIQRLKHGYRNVLLAIVDQGIVSYLRVGDAGFGQENIYERSNSRSKGKGTGARGGRKGGRGRGR